MMIFFTHYTDIDCIIITGSRYDAHQQTPWMIKILKEIKINNIKIVVSVLDIRYYLFTFTRYNNSWDIGAIEATVYSQYICQHYLQHKDYEIISMSS